MVYYSDARKVKFSFDGKVIDAYQMDEEDIKFVKEEPEEGQRGARMRFV
ncbi:MAG: hypothetical protein LBU15_02060 [Rickettsiales bacterium]|jgi:hypothetical protein|nr:hypothetical protein [Rickettsiales bacterium]